MIILTNNAAFCQDIEFNWEINPSFSKSYILNVERKNSDCIIQLKDYESNILICENMSENDCNDLILFLSKYTFKIKENFIDNSNKKRQYEKTKIFNKKTWVLQNGKYIRLDLALSKGLKYDKDVKKYYYENISVCFTDGTFYRGKYHTDNQLKEFRIHSARISDEDYQLNMIICNLIRKYFSNQDYSELLKYIESEKPVAKSYQ